MREISTDPTWLRLSSWEDPDWLKAAIANGTADIVCPRCGRAEKFNHYCSLCSYPVQVEDIRIHTPGDTHACVLKRVPPDALNGGWGDKNVPLWQPEEGLVDNTNGTKVRVAQAKAARDAEGAGDVPDA